jgi:hypothetical protein
MAGTIGKIEPFSEGQCSLSAWIEQLEQYFLVNGVEGSRRAAVLLVTIGSETYSLLRNLVAPAKPADQSYDDLITHLKNHYEPAPQEISERYRFHCRNQSDGETVPNYIAELKRLASTCNFGQVLDDSLRDRLVCGVRSDAIQKRLLSEPKLTFQRAAQLATSLEAADRQGNELRSHKTPWEPSGVNKLRDSKPGAAGRVARRHRSPSEDGSSDSSGKARCSRCKGDHDPDECRFRNSRCRRCDKKGHIARACNSTRRKGPEQRRDATTRANHFEQLEYDIFDGCTSEDEGGTREISRLL